MPAAARSAPPVLEPAQRQPTKPEPANPEPATPQLAKPEPANPEPATPQLAKPEPANLDLTKPQPTKPYPAKSATVVARPVATVPAASATAAPAAPASAKSQEKIKLVIRAEVLPEGEWSAAARQPAKKWHALPLILGAVAVAALIWGGVWMFGTDGASVPTADQAVGELDSSAQQASASTPSSTLVPAPASPSVSGTSSSESTPGVRASSSSQQPAASTAGPESAEPEGDASVSALNEVLPEVPRRARQTIRGTVRVSVRVIVDPEGTVFAALADNSGPSRYFERLAIDAAKKWIFEPAQTDGQRLMLVRFSFTRDGTTARAVPVR
jgi:TonB family protein